MSDTKDALSTLCRCLGSLLNVNLTIEQLRLAKYNSPDESGREALLSALHALGGHVARERRADMDLRNYDTLSAVKLYLAFLQYPAIEFYGLSSSDNQNRVPLIALAWLLGTQDVLSSALRAKLIDGPLGAECSRVDSPESATMSAKHDDRLLSKSAKYNDRPLSTSVQLDNILHLSGKVNLNLKQISELISEWSKLTFKVHAASIDHFRTSRRSRSSEDPLHLSVSELALTKRLAMHHERSAEDRRRLREWRDAGALLDAHAKWLDRRHAFFDWMATVIREHRRSLERNVSGINSQELTTFVSLLRRVLNDEIRLRASDGTANEPRDFVTNCSSRLQRTNNTEETRRCLSDLRERQNAEEESLQRNKDRLTAELREMLRLIPSAFRI